MKNAFLILMIIIPIFLSTLSPAEENFNLGVAAFEQNEFPEALNLFFRVENEGIVNADLYYNIGNCYFRLDEIGRAVLYYKKALKMQSNHEAARRNLQYALTFTQDKQGTESEDVIRSFWTKSFDALSINLLTILVLAIFAAIVLMICLMIIRYRQRERTVPIFITTILTFFLIIFIILGMLKWKAFHDHNEAVLLAASAIGYSGPSEDFTRVFTIHAGMIFVIERQENDWSLIKLSNGLGGWVLSSTFEKI
ncbi:MAG: tetratricopeptide repeat protein [Candidatus Cloacimonadales bacterium]|nr:tetratricopeptide repeat protein [Candidatus Cloacimonadales bacterium]